MQFVILLHRYLDKLASARIYGQQISEDGRSLLLLIKYHPQDNLSDRIQPSSRCHRVPEGGREGD